MKSHNTLSILVLAVLGVLTSSGLGLTGLYEYAIAAPISITQNSTTALTAATPWPWACGEFGGLTTFNHWLRRFDLSRDHGILGPVEITGVYFGVERAGGPRREIPVGVYVRSIPKGAALLWSNMTMLGGEEFLVSVQQPTIVHSWMHATLLHPLTEDLVVEIAPFDGTSLAWLDSYFYIGVNNGSETRPGYWSAPRCDFPEPYALASIGVTQPFVMVVQLDDMPTPTHLMTWGRLKALYR